MVQVARILGVSLLTAGLAVWLGVFLLVGQPREDFVIPGLLLACVGGIIGAVAGAAREIVAALHQRPSG